MPRPSTTARNVSAPWLVWRGAWAAMLLGHFPATLAALSAALEDPSAWARLLVLSLSQAFFLLKTLDVPWLRVRVTARSVFALSAAAALLHADLIAPSGATAAQPLEPWETAAVLTVLAVAGDVLRRREQRLDAVRPRDEARRASRVIGSLEARAARAWLPLRFLLLARSVSIHRAPPALPA